MLSDLERRFLDAQPVARLATADALGRPHVVPVCFVRMSRVLYVTIDGKPKRAGTGELKRVRNIRENPEVALLADHWDEDWHRLGWVMLRGRADILDDGDEHDRAQARLKARYPQYREMDIAQLPVIAMRIRETASWGDLSVEGAS